MKNDFTGVFEMKDIKVGFHLREETEKEKYVGDVISTDGRIIKKQNDIKSTIAKGKGIVSQILIMLDCIPLGKHYFDMWILLRYSLLVSSMFFNAEACYNLTNSELDLLETIDVPFRNNYSKIPRECPPKCFILK